MSDTIIQRLKQRFENYSNKDREKPDTFTRDLGGDFRMNHPFISGYHQLIVRPPEALFGGNIVSHANEAPATSSLGGTAAEAAMWLHSTCESFTPHSVTPNMVDVMGIGQIGSSFMASKTVTREFTTAHREYQYLPIMNVIDQWHSLFDEHVGVSPLYGNTYIPFNYKGKIVVYQLKPTGAYGEGGGRALIQEDLEELYIYQGVYPKTNPRDTIGASDQAANDTVQLSVTWSFDGAPLTMKDPSVIQKALEMINGIKGYMNTYEKHVSHFTSTSVGAMGGAGSQVA